LEISQEDAAFGTTLTNIPTNNHDDTIESPSLSIGQANWEYETFQRREA
jgi:hypothetical protein